ARAGPRAKFPAGSCALYQKDTYLLELLIPTSAAPEPAPVIPAPQIVADGEDYKANLERNQCVWLAVAGASLAIKRTDEGIVVDVYPRGREDREASASAYVFDSGLEAELEEPHELMSVGDSA